MINVALGSLELKSPIIAASGTFGYGSEYVDFYDPSLLGAIVVKGVSLNPMGGNSPPRLCEVSAGLMNAIGLQNPGVDSFIENRVPTFSQLGTPVLANLFGNSIAEFEELAGRLDSLEDVAGLEINISCPNVEGREFASSPRELEKLVAAVRGVSSKPLWVKLAPYPSIIGEIALAAQDGGADALVIANTYQAMKIDVEKSCPVLGNQTGGLSGPGIKSMTMALVWNVHKKVSIPIVASGGVMGALDVVEYLMAGAGAVEIGTVNFVNPMAGKTLTEDLEKWLIRSSYESLNEVIAIAHQ